MAKKNVNVEKPQRKITYKEMFDTLVDIYIKDAPYADGTLPCCMYSDKVSCSDNRNKGDRACRACVRSVVKQKVEDMKSETMVETPATTGKRNIPHKA